MILFWLILSWQSNEALDECECKSSKISNVHAKQPPQQRLTSASPGRSLSRSRSRSRSPSVRFCHILKYIFTCTLFIISFFFPLNFLPVWQVMSDWSRCADWNDCRHWEKILLEYLVFWVFVVFAALDYKWVWARF